MTNYYTLFNISNDATIDEIENAFTEVIVSDFEQQQDIIKGYEILINEHIRKIYDRALVVPTEISDIIFQSVVRASKNEYTKAANICNEGLLRYPMQRELCLTLCDLNEAMHKSNKNLSILVELYDKYPDDQEIVFYLGLVYMNNHKFNEAYKLLSSIYDSMCTNTEYLAYYSSVCTCAKYFHEAKEHA